MKVKRGTLFRINCREYADSFNKEFGNLRDIEIKMQDNDISEYKTTRIDLEFLEIWTETNVIDDTDLKYGSAIGPKHKAIFEVINNSPVFMGKKTFKIDKNDQSDINDGEIEIKMGNTDDLFIDIDERDEIIVTY